MSALNSKVTLHRMAKIAISSIRPQDRKVVMDHIELLKRFHHDESVQQKVRKLKDVGLGDLYIMRVTKKKGIIFCDKKSSIEVMDIVPYERLKRMRELATT